MDSVEKARMRLHALVPLALAALALSACDSGRPTALQPIGVGVFPIGGVGFTTPGPFDFFVSPSEARLAVGQHLQLVANVRDTLETHLQWRSLQTRVAVVTNDGLVTAVGPGRATIVAQFTADTTIVAPATIFVSGVFIP